MLRHAVLHTGSAANTTEQVQESLTSVSVAVVEMCHLLTERAHGQPHPPVELQLFPPSAEGTRKV